MLPNRKLNRLQGFDYSQDRTYFVTFNTKHHIHHFGEIQNGEMIYNANGEIVCQTIKWMEKQYSYAIIHQYVVMPNHVHLLIEMNSLKVQTALELSVPKFLPEIKIQSLSRLIGALKTVSSKNIRLNGESNFEWQRSFYDQIIKSPDHFDRVRNYIIENPKRWKKV